MMTELRRAAEGRAQKRKFAFLESRPVPEYTGEWGETRIRAFVQLCTRLEASSLHPVHSRVRACVD